MDMTKRRPVQNTSNGYVPSWKYLSVYLKDAVEYHLDIINAANAIEDVLHGVFLAFFMYTLSFLCVNIYRASLLAATNVEVLFIVAESLIVYFPTLIICYYGEELAHYSEQVGTVAYQLDFVGTDLRFQKSLILMIQRSQDTLQIKAGRMIGATMNTAVWIIRSAFSAYMMLRTVNT
ncbi:odorant receptor 67a-like [Photinus pyralis]|uniref:odorant receptor 67a-like n=1 Tax=Photinus pyralis TaxID=7054 RepID=UPI0012671723|nr:odorant receptor 67a-like [Photinus pyralis]